MTTIGTHNLHDFSGLPTGFADLLFFTEAIPSKISRELKNDYIVVHCPQQKDLVIAWRKGKFKPNKTRRGKIVKHYILAHIGIAKVTPHRGTFWINGKLKTEEDWIDTTLLAEHRINAAFPPFKRGEKILRPRFWRLHTSITLRIIRRRKKRGYEVVAAGDINTPEGVLAYNRELNEAGHHFDRIGASFKISKAKYLSRMNSDHPRLRVEVA